MRTLIFGKLFFLTIVILLGFLMRFFKLSEFPVQLSHDEISQLYDAISIAQTGRDVYGNFMPFIFPSVGDFKPPFYTYLTSIFYMILGGGEAVIRLASALFGLLMIPAVYFFTLRLLNNYKIAQVAAFFTAIAPFEIFFSRKSFENGAGILLILIGFSLLFVYFENKRLLWFYLAIIAFAAAMYTYFSHAIITPLILIAFMIIFRRQFKDYKKLLGPISLLIVLIFPLIFVVSTNPGAKFRSQTVFIIQDVNLGKNIDYVQTSNRIISLSLKYKTIFDYSLNRYLTQFDPIYLFAKGLDFTDQGLLGMGPLFLIQLPLLILGLVYLVKDTNFVLQKRFIGAWVLLGMLPSGLTFESFSPHRVVMVFTMLNIIGAVGFIWAIQLIRRFNKWNLVLVGFLIIFTYNFIYFLHMYSINFPFEKSQNIQYPFKQIALFAWSQYDNYETVIFDPQFGDVSPMIGVGSHYYLAYYGNYPPAKFQSEYRVGSKPREILFDKFSIRQVYWPTDKDLKNTLFIVSPWSVPLNSVNPNSIIKKFNFYNGKLAFYAIKM